MDSPLLFPVRLKDNLILVLDETKIPFQEVYIEVTTLGEALQVLGSMKTRALGQVLLFFYSCAVFPAYPIEEIAQRFRKARPTFDFPLLAEILKKGIGKQGDIKKVVEVFVRGFDQARRKRAGELACILPSPAHILTICNVNGELLYLYEAVVKLGKQVLFYVCETRPYLQGTRLTFWELRKNNIPCYLICDNQAARLMKEGRVNCVVSGADRATQKGDIINKIGTYALARLAKHFYIPFYPLTQYPRPMEVDRILIEERPSAETFLFLEGDYSGAEAISPAFDIVRSELVTRCIELPLG
jgi:methylthioribose-1-phosphate isomerase